MNILKLLFYLLTIFYFISYHSNSSSADSKSAAANLANILNNNLNQSVKKGVDELPDLGLPMFYATPATLTDTDEILASKSKKLINNDPVYESVKEGFNKDTINYINQFSNTNKDNNPLQLFDCLSVVDNTITTGQYNSCDNNQFDTFTNSKIDSRGQNCQRTTTCSQYEIKQVLHQFVQQCQLMPSIKKVSTERELTVAVSKIPPQEFNLSIYASTVFDKGASFAINLNTGKVIAARDAYLSNVTVDHLIDKSMTCQDLSIQYLGNVFWNDLALAGTYNQDHVEVFDQQIVPACTIPLIAYFSFIQHNYRDYGLTKKGAIFTFRIKYFPKPVITEVWQYSKFSPSDNSNCKLISNHCIDSSTTHIIDGTPVEKSCWRYKEMYECLDWENPTNSCADIEGCQITASNDIDERTKHQTYACSRIINQWTCTQHETVNNCSFDTNEQNTIDTSQYTQGNDQFQTQSVGNFSNAVSYMGILNELDKNQDNTTLSFFKGQKLGYIQSHLGGLGKDCCNPQLIKTKVGLTNDCEDEEVKLAAARRALRTHEIGHYCAAKSPLGCIKTRYVYCSFPSQLTRIIQEKGRQQLFEQLSSKRNSETMDVIHNMYSWGDAEHPNCNGFTQEQLSLLDWSKIDLTEYTNSISPPAINSFAIADSSSINNNIQPSITTLKSALEEGATTTVSKPNAQEASPILVSPLEGQGPFTVTVKLSSNWPQYYVESTNVNQNPVIRIMIDWGDGSYATLNRNQLVLLYGVPVYIIQHTYQAPVGANKREHIVATFYTNQSQEEGGYQATADVVNVWRTPSPNSEAGSGSYSNTYPIAINTMPGYGSYDPSNVPGLPR